MKEMNELMALSDIELLDEFDKIRNRVSYFNAAEGQTHSQEEAQRVRAKQYMTLVESVVQMRKLKPNEGQFLI